MDDNANISQIDQLYRVEVHLLPCVAEKQALTADELREAEKHVDTNPSEAQKESGNYRKGHIYWKGLPIAIENPKGSKRTGVSRDGKKWSTEMHAAYGYFNLSAGADGDHVDVFVYDHDLDSDKAFVIDQIDPDTGKFDEHKVVIGVRGGKREAVKAYLSNYEDGWKGFGGVTELTADELKEWLHSGNTKKPLSSMEKGGFFMEVMSRVKMAYASGDKFTIAVDLDGTLAKKVEYDPSLIGDPRPDVRKWMKRFREEGARIIIFTVRGDKELVSSWLEKHDIPYDYINENPDQPPGSSGKVIADVYIDDRALSAAGPFSTPASKALAKMREEKNGFDYDYDVQEPFRVYDWNLEPSLEKGPVLVGLQYPLIRKDGSEVPDLLKGAIYPDSD